MQLDERSATILEEVATRYKIKSKDIEEKLGLTKRQLDYCVIKINDYLKHNGLPMVKRNRQGIFIVDTQLMLKYKSVQQQSQAKTYIPSELERVEMIVLIILSKEEEISLQHLVSALKVSKNTVLNDLKTVRKRILSQGLVLSYSRQYGYIIEGTEFEKREILIEVTHNVLHMHNGTEIIKQICNLNDVEIVKFRNRLEKIESDLKVKYTDEKIHSSPYSLALICRRIRNGKCVSHEDIIFEELSDTKEYELANRLLEDFEDVPTSERFYITLQLLAINISKIDVLTAENMPKLRESICQVIENFEKNACVVLQEKDILIGNILQHLRPAYYRVKYNLTLSNAFTDVIDMENYDTEFREIHKIVKNSINPIEEVMGCKIPELEFSFITLLIASWVRRQGSSIFNHPRVLIVCPNGISVSNLMHRTLRELFPEFLFVGSLSVREFDVFDESKYDVIFSPVFLSTKKKLFIVDSMICNKDRNRLRNQVLQEIYGVSYRDLDLEEVIKVIEKHAIIKNRKGLKSSLEKCLLNAVTNPINTVEENSNLNLSDLILIENIAIKHNVVNWSESISLAAEPLLIQNCIQQIYVETMIKQYNFDFPYIIYGTEIAVAHATPEDGVNRMGMALLKIDQGVEFGKNKKVHIVVVLAAVDKKQHLKAILQLANLSENSNDIQDIIGANTEEEIRQVLMRYNEVN